MPDTRQRTIGELVRDRELITAAIRKATREAVLQHARAGHSVSTCKDGRVVRIPPAEILARFATEPVQ